MISVIVCHHRGTLLQGALDSLQKSLEVDYEIIVATSDEENFQSWKEKFPTVRFAEIRGGPAHKRNVAYRLAQGDFIAFFDDDVEVTPYTLFYMRQFLKEHSECGMVFGKLLNMEFRNRFDEAGSFLTSTGFLWARAESGILDTGQFEKKVPVLSGKSASCMIRRKVFWKVGGFDASYEILGEETDLSWRVWLYGHSVFYIPDSVTFHAFNTKFKPLDYYIPRRVYFNGCRNYLSMLFTNLGDLNFVFPLSLQLVVWSTAACGMLLTGKHDAGLNILKGIGWFFTHLDSLLAKRKFVQSRRTISDKELFKSIMKNPPARYFINRFFSYIKHGRHGGSYDPIQS